MNLRGVFAPVCTPFQADGDVHHGALRQNLARYARAGLHGFVIAGSTGEAPLLNENEKRRLFETAREAVEGPTLIAGTGTESVRETVAVIGHAAALKYDAALVIMPSFYRSQMMRAETQTAFFRAVADASPLPVLIYNFPQMTGIDLDVEVVARLAEHGNIVGIKESSPDLEKIAKLRSSLPADFELLVGASPKFHQSLCLGASGGILAIANAAPLTALRVYECYTAGDIEASRGCQQQIVEAAAVAPRFGIQGLKYAMDLMGYFGGFPRPPLLPLDASERSAVLLLFQGIPG
jgi:dihydrodipicolinate synthase/N-acetylneuraminate lyase